MLMDPNKQRCDEPVVDLVVQVRDRARNLYESRQMLCAEAVLVAMNQGLDGGLTESQAMAMAAPFCIALGGSGCVCGALSGAVMATGLLLGHDHAPGRRKKARVVARQLHDDFRAAYGATCCRVLTRKVKDDRRAHFAQCADLTAGAAEMAARLVLERRPALANRADNTYLAQRQSWIGGAWLRLTQRFSRLS